MEDIPVYKIRLKLIKIISKRYCRELYLFLAHIGHWILDPHVPVHYLRAKGLSGYIMDYFNGTLASYMDLSSMDTYYV